MGIMQRWGRGQWVCGVHLHAAGGALVPGFWRQGRVQAWGAPQHWRWRSATAAQPRHWAQALSSVLPACSPTQQPAPLAVAVSLDDACFARHAIDLPPWLEGEDLIAALNEAWAHAVGADDAWALDRGAHTDGVNPLDGRDIRRHEVHGLRQADLDALTQAFEGMAWPLRVVMPGPLAWHHALQQALGDTAPECVVMVAQGQLWCLLAGPDDAWQCASWSRAPRQGHAVATAGEDDALWLPLAHHLQEAVADWPSADLHCALWVEDAAEAAGWKQALTTFWRHSPVVRALRLSAAMAPSAEGAARGAVCAWQMAQRRS